MGESQSIGEMVVDGIKSKKSKKLLRVEVVEFDVSFGRLVTLLVKITLAAIPAMILLSLIYIALGAMGLGFLLHR